MRGPALPGRATGLQQGHMGAWMRAWTCRGRPTYRHRVEGERSWLSLGCVKTLHKACLMLGLEVC